MTPASTGTPAAFSKPATGPARSNDSGSPAGSRAAASCHSSRRYSAAAAARPIWKQPATAAQVLGGITVRGSIVGTRLDLREALAFAGAGLVHATVAPARLADINTVLADMRAGRIEGRVVLDLH